MFRNFAYMGVLRFRTAKALSSIRKRATLLSERGDRWLRLMEGVDCEAPRGACVPESPPRQPQGMDIDDSALSPLGYWIEHGTGLQELAGAGDWAWCMAAVD